MRRTLSYYETVIALRQMAGTDVVLVVSSMGVGMTLGLEGIADAPAPVEGSVKTNATPHSWVVSLNGGRAGWVLSYDAFQHACVVDEAVLVIAMVGAVYRMESKALWDVESASGVPTQLLAGSRDGWTSVLAD